MLRQMVPAAEDYLVALAALGECGDPVTGSHLARLLGVSDPSVTQMVTRLDANGLIAKRGAGGIALNKRGTAAAAWLLRRRRVCETFFVDAMGLSWPRALEAADRMEHALTPDGVTRLHRAIGSPTRCPHGNHIQIEEAAAVGPSAAGHAAGSTERDRHPHESERSLSLGALAPATPAVVTCVTGGAEQSAVALAYLERHGIAPWRRIEVEDADPFAAALAIRSGPDRFALSPALAAHVLVRPLASAQGIGGRALREDACRASAPPLPCRQDGTVRITAARVDGPCEAGHAAGDVFVLGRQTPGGLCSATCAALLPLLQQVLTPRTPVRPAGRSRGSSAAAPVTGTSSGG